MAHPGRSSTGTSARREFYRDPSPSASQSSSSASSDFEVSPRTFSAPTTPPASTPHPHVQIAHQHQSDRNLVPLAFLQGIRQPLRDPVDEDCLRRLNGTPRLEHRWQDVRTTLPP
jgi:Gti1/Pac2 family transcription factor